MLACHDTRPQLLQMVVSSITLETKRLAERLLQAHARVCSARPLLRARACMNLFRICNCPCLFQVINLIPSSYSSSYYFFFLLALLLRVLVRVQGLAHFCLILHFRDEVSRWATNMLPQQGSSSKVTTFQYKCIKASRLRQLLISLHKGIPYAKPCFLEFSLVSFL